MLSLLNVKYVLSRVPLVDENLKMVESGRESFEPGDRLLISRVSSLVNGLRVTLELK